MSIEFTIQLSRTFLLCIWLELKSCCPSVHSAAFYCKSSLESLSRAAENLRKAPTREAEQSDCDCIDEIDLCSFCIQSPQAPG